MSERNINGLIKEGASLIKGGWLPQVLNTVIIIGLGFLLWDVVVKDRADIATIKKDVGIIAQKQDDFAQACLKVILQNIPDALPPGRARQPLGAR